MLYIFFFWSLKTQPLQINQLEAVFVIVNNLILLGKCVKKLRPIILRFVDFFFFKMKWLNSSNIRRTNKEHTKKILEMSKLKAFADNKFDGTQNMKYAFQRVENIVRKGEKAEYQHFLLFSQCFKSLFFLMVAKIQDCVVKCYSEFFSVMFCHL